MRCFLTLLSLFLLAACSSGSSGGGSGIPGTTKSGGASTSSAIAAGSLPQPSSTSPVWVHPKANNAVATPSTAPSATTPSTSTTSTNPTTGSTGAPAVSPGNTGPQLLGSIPPDPETGFNGQLYFVGERLEPGSSILVTFQGVPIKTLPANFYSSELLSSYVFLTIPGDYRFEAVAPNGSVSGGFDITIPQGGLPGVFSGVDPAIHMSFPSQFQQGFLGSIYLMGDHFVQGAQLIVQAPNLPPAIVPLTFINSRTLAWTISAPLPGSVSIQVLNPDLRTSSALTLTFQGSQFLNTGTLPRPTVAFGPSLLSSPFVGSSHIYGQDFLPGAFIEWKELSSNQVTVTPAGFISNQELLWTLVYPAPGQYELVVVNPDNQRSMPMTVDVQ